LTTHAAAPAQARHRAPEVRRWLAHDYPIIAKFARASGKEIYWGGETGVSNQANYGRGFAPEGQMAIVTRLAKPFAQHLGQRKPAQLALPIMLRLNGNPLLPAHTTVPVTSWRCIAFRSTSVKVAGLATDPEMFSRHSVSSISSQP